MTCPDIIPGTVTDQTGPIPTLTDVTALAESGEPTIQTQQPILASDRPGVCQRERDARTASGGSSGLTKQSGETWLMVALYRYHCVPGQPDGGSDLTVYSPLVYPIEPVTLHPSQGAESPAGSGNAYTCTAKLSLAKGSDQTASTGTVVVSRWSPEQVELTYDLTFKAGRVIGRMVAPGCVVC